MKFFFCHLFSCVWIAMFVYVVTKDPYDINLGCPIQIMAYLIMIGTRGSLFVEPNLHSIFTTKY